MLSQPKTLTKAVKPSNDVESLVWQNGYVAELNKYVSVTNGMTLLEASENEEMDEPLLF